MSEKLSKSRLLRRAVYFLIMAGFLYLILRKLNLHELISTLRKASFALLVPAILVYLSGFYLRALKWRVILTSLKDIRPGALLRYILVGCSGNAMLPARMGEVLRAWIAGREESLSALSLFSTILIERFLEVLSLMILLFISVKRLSVMSLHKAAAVIMVITAMGFVLLAVACFTEGQIIRLAQHLIPWKRTRTRVIGFFEEFVSGIKILRNPLRLSWVVLLGLGVYLIEALAYWGVAKAFHIEVSITQVLFLVSFIFVGLTIPSTVGNIGPLQYFCILGLSFFGIDKGAALVYSIFLNLMMYLPAVIGLAYLYKFGISLRELRARIQEGATLSEQLRQQGEIP
jgi:uncharacterized protein (TIRG00374 family)